MHFFTRCTFHYYFSPQQMIENGKVVIYYVVYHHQGIYRQEREACQSSASSSEPNNEWGYTSTSQAQRQTSFVKRTSTGILHAVGCQQIQLAVARSFALQGIIVNDANPKTCSN
jgi:hypothetical protein